MIDVTCKKIYLIMKPDFTWQGHQVSALAEIALSRAADSADIIDPLVALWVGIQGSDSGEHKVIQNRDLEIVNDKLWQKVETVALRACEYAFKKNYEPSYEVSTDALPQPRENLSNVLEKTLIKQVYDGDGNVQMQVYTIS